MCDSVTYFAARGSCVYAGYPGDFDNLRASDPGVADNTKLIAYGQQVLPWCCLITGSELYEPQGRTDASSSQSRGGPLLQFAGCLGGGCASGDQRRAPLRSQVVRAATGSKSAVSRMTSALHAVTSTDRGLRSLPPRHSTGFEATLYQANVLGTYELVADPASWRAPRRDADRPPGTPPDACRSPAVTRRRWTSPAGKPQRPTPSGPKPG